MSKEIEVILAKKGHSDPSKAAIEIVEQQRDFRDMDAHDMLMGIKSNDRELKRWIEKDIQDSFREHDKDARRHGEPGITTLDEIYWHTARIERGMVKLMGKYTLEPDDADFWSNDTDDGPEQPEEFTSRMWFWYIFHYNYPELDRWEQV